MRYSYRFFVIKNESANKIAVSRYIFEKIELKITKNGTFGYFRAKIV